MCSGDFVELIGFGWQVLADVTSKFREFKSNNKMAKLQGGDDGDQATVAEMIQAMKGMPEYKTMMRKYVSFFVAALWWAKKLLLSRYHKHMSLAEECMLKFKAKKLKVPFLVISLALRNLSSPICKPQDLGELEQDMATGLTNDGAKAETKNISATLVWAFHFHCLQQTLENIFSETDQNVQIE